MRLKRLDIVGFKSFVDKTVVQFDDGVTGIVGPNGCGKSNIVDAIRWVLGEQSPKHLRGAAMQDVIFNGSQSRAPHGLAEVTLTFHNDDPAELPLRYQGFPEIAITRRLFRSGESEYQLNKTPCRLMDITEVFLGTGVGTKAYSIIEQGRIGLIVSAKADDRRSLIEEAAGITRYKAKKKVAERKMEATRNNLLRVGDLVSELGKRLDSLQRQAKKAERYRRLKGDLREIELHIATHRWLEISAVRRDLASRIAGLREEASGTEAEVTRLETDIRARRDRLAVEEDRLTKMQAEALEAEGQAKVREERVSGLVREQETLDARTRQAREEMAALRLRLEELAAEQQAAEAALAELAGLIEADEAELTAKSGELGALQQELSRLDLLIEAERRAALDAVSTVSQGRSHLAALEKQRADLEIRRKRGDEEIERIQARLDELSGNRVSLEQKLGETRQLHLRLETERVSHEEALERCLESLVHSEVQLRELRDELADKRGRLGSLLEIQRNYEGYEQGVRAIMLHKDDIDGVGQEEVVGLVADVIRSSPPYEQAVEAVLGERLQWVLVGSNATGVRAIDWLSRTDEGRGSFVPLADLAPATADADLARTLEGRPGVVAVALDVVRAGDEYADLLRHLLGGVVVVESLSSALTLRREAPGVTFVTLAGEVVSAAGVLTGGAREGAGAGLLQTKREIEELTVEVKRLETALATAQEEHERLVQRRTDLEKGLKELARDAHAEQINIVTQEKEVHRLSDEVVRLEERRTTLEGEGAQLDEAILELGREEETTRAAMESARSDQETREARTQALNAELEQNRASFEAAQNVVMQLRVKAAADAGRRESTRREIERAIETRADVEARIARLEAEVSGSGDTFEALAARMEEGRAEAVRLKDRAEKLRTELGRARETYQAAQAAVRKDEQGVSGMRERHEQAERNAGKLELQDRELELEVGHLADAVSERQACELLDVICDWHLRPPPSEVDLERLGELRGKLERMGEVNLTAIEEYEEISERHEFLSKQKEDLDRSLAQLQKAITKINRTSRERFLQTFELVNDKFQRVFPRLFNGGKAGLALTDPTDPLNSGVEIFAQPPGKKLQNVNLLSGGEKALTAVSLIFSIFLIRPTPFCLLDEVDAPLDDNNVGRYNQLVREMSRHSQFVVITHNKATMEVVDTLYGVTMQEPGCSKLVSVRLSDDEAQAA